MIAPEPVSNGKPEIASVSPLSPLRLRPRSLSASDIHFLPAYDLTADEADRIWRRVERMPYLFDDSIRNPFSFAAILSSPQTRAFIFGRPAAGLAWFYSVSPGVSAGCAFAALDFRSIARHDLLRVLISKVAFAPPPAGLDLHRLFAIVAAPNRASHRLLISLKFREEGLIREGLRYNSRWTDLVTYGLLRSEFEGA